MREFDQTVHTIIKPVTQVMSKMLPFSSGPERQLIDAMCYSSLDGGKFWRPTLAYFVCQFYDLPVNVSSHIGAAVEFMHAGSLAHDDLPCMDDADMRRNKPSCHCAFDEETAVLAGGALYVLAIEALIHQDLNVSSDVRCALIASLVRHAGARGMMGGKMHDLLGNANTPEALVSMHQLKTGALLSFCCEAPGIVAQVPQNTQDFLCGLGEQIGVLYQIVDDLIDLQPVAFKGKTSVRDQDAATYATVLGKEKTQAQAMALARGIVRELDEQPHDTSKIIQMIENILDQVGLSV